jgi:phage tail-like protein
MPAPEFKVNTYRYDPYRNFKFRVKWGPVGGKLAYVMGVSQVSGLTRQTQSISHRSGGDPSTPRALPGQTTYQPITMQQGVTHDLNFEIWANKVWDYHNSTQSPDQATNLVSLKDFRKDMVIELYNLSGQKVMAYNVYRCWVSEYTAMPELNANGNEVAIRSITIQNEGWERDTSVAEPQEISFDLPQANP